MTAKRKMRYRPDDMPRLGICPRCTKQVLWPEANGAELLRFDDGHEELWHGDCRRRVAPGEIGMMIGSAWGDAKDRAALAKLDEKLSQRYPTRPIVYGKKAVDKAMRQAR